MSDVKILASSETMLDCDYAPVHPRIHHLFDMARKSRWDETQDIDWTRSEALPSEQSAFGRVAFERSSLARFGEQMWHRFRAEQQAWMVSQFLHGEQSALIVSERLSEGLPDAIAKSYAASQAAEEARHLAVFARYARERALTCYPVSNSFEILISQIVRDPRWDIQVLGMHVMIESLALAAFRLAASTFEDVLIREITQLTARDEARHVSFGIMLLKNIYPGMSASERREREDFVIEGAGLLSQRYLLTELWERLGVGLGEGTEFSRSNEMMRAYRCTIFTRVVYALKQVGLFSPRVAAALDRLGLLGVANLQRRWPEQ